MKLSQICKISSITCEDFGYRGKNKHLAPILRYSPQHIIYSGPSTRLIYFKPSFDPRFIELLGDEIRSIRSWDAGIIPTNFFIFNYKIPGYTLVTVKEINEKFYKCRKENQFFLLENINFTWRREDEPFSIG